MKPYLIVFVILFISLPIKVQGQKKISGTVQSQTDSTSLEFAHIYLKNSTIGTYSNSEGQFVLHYPDTSSYDTLVISRIGYGECIIPLLSSNTATSFSIYVQESKSYLDEVVITTHKDTVAAIVKKALRSMRKNYPTKLHYLEGFYRELSLRDDQYTRLIEASIGITESSYRQAQTTSKVKVRQIRKSEDYREYSWKFKRNEDIMNKMVKLAWGKQYAHHNNIYRLLLNNTVRSNRNLSSGKKKKATDFVSKYDFEIAKVTKVDDEIYYHINYKKPLESSALGYFSGSMVINMNDYAIVEHSWGKYQHPYKENKFLNLYYKKQFLYKFHIIYSKIEDKYYPTYFESFEHSMRGTALYEDEETGEKKAQFNKITFMVNQVVTKKRDFDRIKKREALEDELDLYDVDQAYDSAFWANYNILLIDPLLKPAIEDLEKEKSLNKQFENNGE
ncbi:MAG: carboxypeptidase-like regulatory domain-containing protein [Ekhidna sp.]